MYVYLIGYIHPGGQGRSFLNRTEPLNSIEAVQSAEQAIAEHNHLSSVGITSITLLSGPAESSGD